MKKILCLLVSFSFFIVSIAIAESNLVDIPADELLDVYLQDQDNPSSSRRLITGSSEKQSSANTENKSYVYKEDATKNDVEKLGKSKRPSVAATNLDENTSSSDLEVIKLDDFDEEVKTIELDDTKSKKVATTSSPSTSKSKIRVNSYCQQNSLKKECLYSKYLSICAKDPQSPRCKSQLEKFEGFCKTFPRAYKCKKAQLASKCSQQPKLEKCQPFTQRYCQMYPNAEFCNWN